MKQEKPKLKRILYIVGMVRPWAISYRAQALAAKLCTRYEIQIVGYRHAPKEPNRYHIVHIQTPAALDLILAQPRYVEHPRWGFEIISTRSNAHIAKRAKEITNAKFCVAKNPRLADYAEGHVTCPITYIPNGVDERTFFPMPIKIGWCGNKRPEMQEYKGVHLVREAVERLARKWRTFAHIMFSEDPGSAPARILAKSEIAPWYRTLDAYVNASEGEGCSNTILEALASGVPVVSTDTGIAPELAKKCDLRIVPRTVDGIEAALIKIIKPIMDRRELMYRKYRWSEIANKYAALYEKVLP